jgi:cobalt-zinc-cadmium efflux system membrane fusion protein
MEAGEPLLIRGDLRDRRRYSLAEVAGGAAERPDLLVLEAGAREAEADVRLGRALAWPDLGLGAAYERDDGNNVALGLVTLTLPIFDRGQGMRAEGMARQQRIEFELEASRRALAVEVRAAFDAYERRIEAVNELERRAAGARGQRVVGAPQLRRGTAQPRRAPVNSPRDGRHTKRICRPAARRRTGGCGARSRRGGAAMRHSWPSLLLLAFVTACPSESHDEHAEDAHAPAAPGVTAAAQSERNVLAVAPDMLRDLRLTTAAAEARTSGEGVTALGELTVNEDAYAEIRSAVAARVTSILVGIGDSVHAGDPLLELSSVEVGKAGADYTRARARAQLAAQTLQRKRGLAADRIVPQRELQEAEAEAAAAAAELEAAQAGLRALGLSPDDVRGGAAELVLRTPIDGTIIDRKVVRGQMVEPTDTLARVAGLAKLWLIAHVFERDAVRVQAGAPVRATFPALPGRTYPGSVMLVGQQVDPSSRTIPVRIEIGNDGVLKPGMPASAWMPLGTAGASIVAVPTAALQRCDDGWCVFIPRSSGSFEVRPVGRGRDLGGEIEVVNGLAAGETVVVDGAFLLKAERERAKGAGEHHDH